jgi:NAD(P)-dependent dehydrogenase (short-subunit alcohol dehydrogenase family)
MTNRFTEKVVIVTGAAGDIGSAAVRRFAAEGASVVAVDRIDAEVVAGVNASGGDAIAVIADVTQERDVQRYVNIALSTFGRLDVLFNNAGIEGDNSSIEDYSTDTFDQVMDVNVRGVFLGMKYAVPAMRKTGGGAIINTASVAGISGAAGFSAYCASKHAVIGLTKSVAKQHGADNIRVNAICPSAMTGKMMKSIEEKIQPDNQGSVEESVRETIPLGRYAMPDDVVSMVTYLASNEACFINGGVYTIDGGLSA